MLKALGRTTGLFFSLPMQLRYLLFCLVFDADRAFSLLSESAGRKPGLLGQYTRYAFYRFALDRCGNDVQFGYQTLLSKTDAQIGDRVYLGRFCAIGRVTIESDVRIADGVQLLSGRHHHGSADQGVNHTQVQHEHITIGQGAWIGANAVVMADVGEGAIVGAGSVVTKPVIPGTTVAGVPAKPIDKQVQARRAA